MRIRFLSVPNLPQSLRELDLHCGFFGRYAWFALLAQEVFAGQPGETGYLLAEDAAGAAAVAMPVHYLPAGRLTSLSCFYTPLYDVACTDPATLGGFFRALQGSGLRWRDCTLYALPAERSRTLMTGLAAAGLPCTGFFCFGNWYLPVEWADFDAYWASRSSRLRNTVKRKSAKFRQMPGARMELFCTAEVPDAAIGHYHEVYAASWKPVETHPGFIAGLMSLAARQQALRLAIAYIGAEPVAAQFWIVADETAYIYKLAYKTAHKELGIGSLLTAGLMRYVLDVDRVRTVDYLSGDDAYKQEWMTRRRERLGLRIYNPASPGGTALYAADKLKNWARQAITAIGNTTARR